MRGNIWPSATSAQMAQPLSRFWAAAMDAKRGIQERGADKSLCQSHISTTAAKRCQLRADKAQGKMYKQDRFRDHPSCTCAQGFLCENKTPQRRPSNRWNGGTKWVNEGVVAKSTPDENQGGRSPKKGSERQQHVNCIGACP